MMILPPRQAAKRKQIVDTARQLFLTRGYAGTSMDLITSEAGISKMTLYRYYPTKEALFSGLLHEVIDELTEEKQPELTNLPAPANREQLYDILLKMAHVISEKLSDPLYLSILRIIFSEAARFPELRDLYLQSTPRSIGLLADLLQRSKQNGLVRLADEDIGISILMFIGPFVSNVFNGVLGSTTTMPSHALEQLCRIYVDAITFTP